MAKRVRSGKLAFAVVEPADPLGHLTTADFEKALVPGTWIERYDRVWRMGRWQLSQGIFTGRIGYERAGDVAELWDDSISDFRASTLREGLTSPFALNPETGLIAFQLRSGRIQPHSFTGAFRSLLAEATRVAWRVTVQVREQTLDHWLSTVRRVDRLELRLERPNPNYRGRQAIERLIEGTRAGMAKVILEADDNNPAGLDVGNAFVREAIDHAQDYGTIKAVGDIVERQRSREVQWRSEVEGSPKEARVPADPETKDADPDELRRAVRDNDA